MIGLARGGAGGRQIGHFGGVEITDAIMANLTGGAQGLEAAEGLFQRMMTWPMKQVEVERFNAEPP